MKTKAEFLEELDATQKAVNDLIAELAAGASLSYLRAAGASLSYLRAAGASLSDLLAAGASLSDLRAAGASWSYLRKWINSLPDDKSANN